MASTHRVGDFAITRSGSRYHGHWNIVHEPTGLTTMRGCPLAYIKIDIHNGRLLEHMRRDHDAKLRRASGDNSFHHFEPITGIKHVYPRFPNRYCEIHDRECNPTPPVTIEQVLGLAAKDPTLNDDVFTLLRRALNGEPVVDSTGGGR